MGRKATYSYFYILDSNFEYFILHLAIENPAFALNLRLGVKPAFKIPLGCLSFSLKT